MVHEPARSPRALSAVTALVALAATFASCSTKKDDTSTPANASVDVGSAGASVVLPGVASVVVPPAAVDADVTVSLEVVDRPPVPAPARALSKIVAVTPHGLAFASPPRITLEYEGDASSDAMSVVRLAGPSATTWEAVGGVTWTGGGATFETTRFSYYAVVAVACTDAARPACTSSCQCCGTAYCVDLKTDPQNCGACGNACGADAYCDSQSGCQSTATSRLCDNRNVLTVYGELPPLTVVAPAQTTDGASAKAIANAIASRCPSVKLTSASQAAPGVLDACTDAPLQTGGTTDLVVGGGFGQRIARFLQRNGLAPYVLTQDDTGAGFFANRQGVHLVDFAGTALNPGHDYFVVALIPEPQRGALVLQVYGVGWEGTPAAVWWFEHVAMNAIATGTRTWQRNVLVEWTDDGDGVKGPGDTFRIVAQDQ